MSREYDEYLKEHVGGVSAAYLWLENYIPEVIPDEVKVGAWDFTFNHDRSKYSPEEYHPYDAYFYGNKSYKVVNDFNYAWLHHIHQNPHHWQYWVLINDDEKDGTIALEMPERYVIEMICDWWSFSHKTGDLYEIFKWYDDNKERMILHDATRKKVEYILQKIKETLDEMKERGESLGIEKPEEEVEE